MSVEKKIMVRAREGFASYRNQVLGLKKKEFRSLQRGEVVPVGREFFRKYNHILEEVKKNGN